MSDPKELTFTAHETPVPWPGHFNAAAAARVDLTPNPPPGASMATHSSPEERRAAAEAFRALPDDVRNRIRLDRLRERRLIQLQALQAPRELVSLLADVHTDIPMDIRPGAPRSLCDIRFGNAEQRAIVAEGAKAIGYKVEFILGQMDVPRLCIYPSNHAFPRAPEINIIKIDVLQHPAAQPGIYIGRTCGGEIASPLANPYSTKEHGRLGAVELYRTWLADKVTKEKDPVIIEALTGIRDQFRAGYDVTLKCWCAPSLCHGEVIRDAVLNWEF